MYERLYKEWLKQQVDSSSGERRRRLLAHGHAEKRMLQNVLIPAIGSFENVHAEYEVHDFRDGTRFLDYAILLPSANINVECDGYASHVRDADRRKHSDDLMRQNHLVLDNWKVLRFSYDDVQDRPRQCQQIVQQLIGRWSYRKSPSLANLRLKEREILRLAALSRVPVTPSLVTGWLQVSPRTARQLLRQLAGHHLLVPASGAQRIRSYRLHPSAAAMFE